MPKDPASLDQRIDNAARQVARALLARGGSLATAESCTGGWVAKVLTDLSGSSQWFERGFVTYSNEAKMDMLSVPAETLKTHGAVSEQTVADMAAGVLANSPAQFAIAISGVAGPTGGTAEKPVGMVCFGWDDGRGNASAETVHFGGDRDAVRRQAVLHGLNGLLRMMGVDSSRKRLFFALWPQPETQQALGDVANAWELEQGVKRHPASNLHVTLEFVGPTDGQTQACMEAAADRVRAESFDLSIGGSGVFKRAQVAWLGVVSGEGALQALQGQLIAELNECGYQPDDRPYRPHMTVARKLRHPPVHHDFQAIEWRVDRFALVESRSADHGVEYVPLRFWDLG
ncbi:MAG: RNA 2',3'-cyclic phosphodiesterase [Gammaproteobacteria bacterium]